MATVKAFNDMMEQFLTELNLTFPENKSVIKFQAAFELARTTRPAAVLDNFMSSVKKYSKKIMTRDSTFITEDTKNIKGLMDLDLAGIWENATDVTKDAIWQYLYTLVVLGTTITSLPKETLGMIEKMAESCATQIQEGGGAGDLSSLMELMNTISQPHNK
jgi:hypothetical protein